jgi:CRISPR system Cascade subunit CasB
MNSSELKKEFITRTASQLHSLSAENPANKALLSNLRKLTKTTVEDAVIAWPLLYRGAEYTVSEQQKEKLDKALLTTLNLFAIHARSNKKAYLKQSDGGKTVGSVLASMKRTQSNPDAFDRKITSLLGEDTYEDIVYKLSALLRQQTSASLDYASLAWDLYLLQTEQRQPVILKWGKAYYSLTPNLDTTTKKEAK